jgi:hypothetical protein
LLKRVAAAPTLIWWESNTTLGCSRRWYRWNNTEQ